MDIVDIGLRIIKWGGCTAKSTRPGSLVRQSAPTLLRQSTQSRLFGPPRSPCEPDRHPCKHAWLRDGCREQGRLYCIVRGVDCKLRGCVCRHTRSSEVPGHDDCIDAGADASNATVLHGNRATAPLGIYTLQQQQRSHRSALRQPSTGSRGSPAPTSYQQPGGVPGGQRPVQLPTPFKKFKNWNYCHTHGRDVNNNHTGMLCCNPGPAHNPNAMRKN